jgi:uncharacterized protein DUF6941
MSDEPNDHELQGPFLAAALLCESVLQEKDGRLSIIRVINRITQQAVGADTSEKMPAITIRLTALISFRAGFARGSYNVKLRPITPSGKRLPEVSLPILLEGEDRGHNLILPVMFQAAEEGLYWFDVLLAERLITRIPLRLLYQRITMTP